MHNTKGMMPAQLETFSGTVTLAQPHDLPEGGSPRNQNADYSVGSVYTRAGLFNPFVYADNSAGPVPGGAAVDTPLPNGAAWANVANVLSMGLYATASVAASQSIAASVASVTQTGSNQYPWGLLSNIVVASPGTPATIVPRYLANTAQVVFQASIPIGAAITGLQLSFYAYTDPASALNGEVMASFGSTTEYEVIDYGSAMPYMMGGPTDTWGTSFTAANLASGIILNFAPRGVSQANYLAVYGLTLTVYYALGTTDAIDITEFGFSIPSTATPQGFMGDVLAMGSAGGETLSMQMLKNGVPVGTPETVTLSTVPETYSFGGFNDLFGASWTYSDLNNLHFGIRLTITSTAPSNVSIGYSTLQAYFTPTQRNYNYVTTFKDSFGSIRTLALDANGEWWIENVSTNPGVLSPLFGGPPAGSFASSFTADSRQFIAISDLLQGNYPPQGYNGQWNDRISQVGPGMAPTFTPIPASGIDYPIVNITQPPAYSMGYSYFLQSSGPGATDAGTVVTVYYQDSTLGSANADLTTAFNSGNPTYIYTSFTGGPSTQGPYTVLVTSVGEGQPPGQPRQFYYFTYNVSSSIHTYYQGSGHSGYTANWQRTLATLTTTTPVPGLEVGGTFTVAGNSVANWNTSWMVAQSLNSGAFNITGTSVASGVATYNYTTTSGANPAAGEKVTVTGTSNANGQLNVVNTVIASASGGSTGTFTVNVSLPNFPSAIEEGQATTAGTIFAFDPGLLTLGTATDPIYGTGTGGNLVFSGTTIFMTAGERQGSLFFITRNGLWSPAAPPTTFTVPENTVSIQASNVLIGPPDTIARGIILTEAGQNGVPGGSFYYIPTDVIYTLNGVQTTATSTTIEDNTSTSKILTFTDSVLLNAEEVDIQGNDLFNLVELPDAAWCVQYAGRSVFGRVRNQIQNYVNMTFDGGYLLNPGGPILPAGWNLAGSTLPAGISPTLLVSPVFGNSYYAANTSGAEQAQFAMIYQGSHQDYEGVQILKNQTAYSVRVTARIPSNILVGSLVIDLTTNDPNTGFGVPYGSFVLPFSSMSSAMATYEGTLLVDIPPQIPTTSVIRLWAQNIGVNSDFEVDRISVFPTEAPTNLTGLTISYLNDWESFDDVTGGVDTTTENAQPANGGFVLNDLLYIAKEGSLGYLSNTPNQEPSNWNPFKEVSNVAGASGINALDVGEKWAIMACQNGLFLFNGGQPMACQLEINDIWKAINWAGGGHTVCVRNDVASRRILVAVPLPTPNPWMLDATPNPNPTTPNVILALNYFGIGDVNQLIEAMSMKVTIMGKLAIHDLRRKWSLWTIPTPYISQPISRAELYALPMICNGIGSSKIYTLTGPQGYDDMVPFTSSYCTYGFINQAKAQEQPLFGLFNKRYLGYDALLSGSGNASITFYQNILAAPYPYSTPGGIALSDPAANDIEGDLNEFAQRLFCEVVVSEGYFNLSRVTLYGKADAWSPIRGIKS